MKRIITILFLVLSISCFSQTIRLNFNTISVIDKESSVVLSTVHRVSKFTITETTVNLTTDISSTNFHIEGTPTLKRLDGMECLLIKCRGYAIEGIVIVRDKPLNGIYLIYKDKLVRYYNS